MNFTPKTAHCLLMIILFIVIPATHASYGVGDRVNDFTLNDAHGNPVTLSDFHGMTVLLNFWSPG